MIPLPLRYGILFGAALAFAVPRVGAQGPVQKSEARARNTASAPESASRKTDIAQQDFDSAQTYQLAGDLDSAANEYRKAIAAGLDHLGNLRAARQDYSGAEQLLQQALAANPNDTDARVDLAISELYSGEMSNSEKEVKAVLQTNPDHFRAHALLGKIDFLQGNY